MNDDNTDKLKPQKPTTDTLEWRVSNIEKHNQIRRIESQDGKTYFDTENGVIVINDGINNRVVLDGGSMKVSQAGYDADTTADDKLVMSSDFNMMKIVLSGTASVVVSYDGGGDPVQEFTATVSHSLGYIPSALVYTDNFTSAGRTQVPNSFYYLGDTLIPYAHVSYYLTSTQIVFVITTMSSSTNGTRSFKYYLMRETAT